MLQIFDIISTLEIKKANKIALRLTVRSKKREKKWTTAKFERKNNVALGMASYEENFATDQDSIVPSTLYIPSPAIPC